MTLHLNSGLPFDVWPSEDKLLWDQAFENGDIFDSGPGVLLAQSTRDGRKAAYSLWLGFLDVMYPELLELPPEKRITKAQVEEYVSCLGENCRDTTIAHNIGRLFYAIRAMCPQQEWDWLYLISYRIAKRAEPIQHPQVLSSDLYSLGLRLMDSALVKANAMGRLSKSCAVRYRDGLLIAALVEAPMRRGPFSRLQIGEHALRVGKHWALTVPADMTKTKVSQEYELSARLSGYMDRFLTDIRPAFPGASSHTGLWPHEGCPMTDKMIRRRLIKRTHLALGFAVSPHRFRNAAATFISIADPENIRVSKDLLGHRSFQMTEKHYIDGAQSRIAGHQLDRLLTAARQASGA